MRRVHVIDSHTAGEPTRLITGGGPDLGPGSVADRAARFGQRHAAFRRALLGEPHGSRVAVGALLLPAGERGVEPGVIFFNDVGPLGMCGHGTIGVVTSLAHLHRIRPGPQGIETPVGRVTAELHPDGTVSFENVLSYRYRTGVTVSLPGGDSVVGDIAYGGNWFFLVDGAPVPLTYEHTAALTAYAREIRGALAAHGITGAEAAEIDHIEISGPAAQPENQARNFVLCPGGEYDRSPCGTGTSAKLACLVASGGWPAGRTWRQEGILGTVFEARAERLAEGIRPTVRGRAYLTGEGDVLFDEDDPFVDGISP